MSPSIPLSTSPSAVDTLSDTANASENGRSDSISTTPNVVIDEDYNVGFGFQRREMYRENISGTIPLYGRHLFLCYKSHEDWPARVETSDSYPFPKRFHVALVNRINDIPVRGLLTICESGNATGLSDGDVLMFPDMIKYRCLEESTMDSFVEDVLVSHKPWASGIQEALRGTYVFVCAHNSRDKRFEVCGPVLIDKFSEEIERRGLKDDVFVIACSYIGSPKYAGNLIIFSAKQQDERVSGHWYGYVTPNDVPELLDQHIMKGEIIERIWRGEMGVPPVKIAVKETTGGCCQGLSCCRRDESSEVKKSTYKFDLFTKKWEIFTAGVVVGAVATVAVATVAVAYRRSRLIVLLGFLLTKLNST